MSNDKLRLGRFGRIGAVLTMSGAAAATALALTPGTFGGFTSGTSNPGNTVSAGTVQMTNSVGDGSALTLTGHDYASNNLAPGHYATGSVLITNSGSLPAGVTVQVKNVTIKNGLGNTVNCATDTSGICSDYSLTITDSETSPATVYNATLANAGPTAVKSSAGDTTWTAGGSDTFSVKVTLNGTAGNEAQGSSASFDLAWASASV